jgi:hypothetical protein
MYPKLTDTAEPKMNGIEVVALLDLLDDLWRANSLPKDLEAFHRHLDAIYQCYPHKHTWGTTTGSSTKGSLQ